MINCHVWGEMDYVRCGITHEKCLFSLHWLDHLHNLRVTLASQIESPRQILCIFQITSPRITKPIMDEYQSMHSAVVGECIFKSYNSNGHHVQSLSFSHAIRF